MLLKTMPRAVVTFALAAATLLLAPATGRAQAGLPEFTFQNFDGRPITTASLMDKTTIVAPTYAKCIFACPVITFFLAELDAELGAPDHIQYLHVSVQPEEDTADEILSHFEKHEIDATRDRRWLFANGPTADIHAFLTELGIGVTRTPVEDGFVIEHPIRLYVVGPDGATRASFDTYFWKDEDMRDALDTSHD